MDLWMIEDTHVIEALRNNGFICEHPKHEYEPGKYLDPTPDYGDWHQTDCPIGVNKLYTLGTGQALASRGTHLVLIEQRDALQQRLDLIESHLLFVSGFLNMLKQIGGIHRHFLSECDDHLNELGEAMEATLSIKEELGLHSELKQEKG